MKFNLISSNPNGNIVYSESHLLNSGDDGVINLVIGKGVNILGSFSAVNWGDDDYFLGRSLDVFISRLRKYLKVFTVVTLLTLLTTKCSCFYILPHAKLLITSNTGRNVSHLKKVISLYSYVCYAP